MVGAAGRAQCFPSLDLFLWGSLLAWLFGCFFFPAGLYTLMASFMFAAKLTLGSCTGLAVVSVYSVRTLWALFRTSSKACSSGSSSSSEAVVGSKPGFFFLKK